MIYTPRVCKAMNLLFMRMRGSQIAKKVEPESRLHFH